MDRVILGKLHHSGRGKFLSFRFLLIGIIWVGLWGGFVTSAAAEKPLVPAAALLVWHCDPLSDNPLCAGRVNTIQMFSPQEGWAAGEQGMLLHYIDGHWERVQAPGLSPLASLFTLRFSDPAHGWLSGLSYDDQGALQGLLLKYESGTWSLFPAPPNLGFREIAILSTYEAWAVSSGGRIFHYTIPEGSAVAEWQNVASPTGYPLNGLTMRSTKDGWAVGNFGTILRFSQVGAETEPTWKEVASGTQNLLTRVAYDPHDPRQAWAIGEKGTILKYDGVRWQQVYAPTTARLEAMAFTPYDGWAVGEGGTLLRYQGGTWDAATYAPVNEHLYGISASSTGEVWVTGDRATLLYYPGGQSAPWEILSHTLGLTYTGLYAAAPDRGSAPLRVWAAGLQQEGARSTAYLLQGGDIPWQIAGTFPNYVSMALGGVGASDLYALGAQVDQQNVTHIQAHYLTATGWEQRDTGLKGVPRALAVYATAAGGVEGWGFGDAGLLLHLQQGSWTSVSSPTDRSIEAVVMVGERQGFAVGAVGTILRYHKSSQGTGFWQRDFSASEENLHGVAVLPVPATGSIEGWAVGDNGLIQHLSQVHPDDDPIWEIFPSPTHERLLDVIMPSLDEAWAVGAKGTLLHFSRQANSWQIVPTGTDYDLTSVAGFSSVFLWAGGTAGVMLQAEDVLPPRLFLPLLNTGR